MDRDHAPTPPVALQPHEQRVLDERDDLQGKVDRLLLFTDTSIFRGLDSTDQLLLRHQLDYMRGYLGMLERRIERFGSTP
jgi:hypothetical protein